MQGFVFWWCEVGGAMVGLEGVRDAELLAEPKEAFGLRAVEVVDC